MKNLRTILATLLALFVLTSAIGHSVSFHFCGGEIQSMAFFGPAQQCEQHDNACDHSDRTNHASLHHKDCCEDTTLLIDTDKYRSIQKATIENSPFVYVSVGSQVQEINSYSRLAHHHFFNYRPPLIERDITLLVQSFLI